jgi:hypothetical protein
MRQIAPVYPTALISEQIFFCKLLCRVAINGMKNPTVFGVETNYPSNISIFVIVLRFNIAL